MTRRGDHNRLAAAIHLGFIRMTGRPLDAFETIPPRLFHYLGKQFDIETPDLSSLTLLYQRRRTLFDHQKWAIDVLGFKPFSEGKKRSLVAQMRKETQITMDSKELVSFALSWLYENRTVIPGQRRIKDLARSACAEAEVAMLEIIKKEIPAKVRKQWFEELFKSHNSKTILEWLQKPPQRRSPKGLSKQIAKFEYLKSLGLDTYKLEDLRFERQRKYAAQMRHRRPVRFKTLGEPRRTLEMVCFLRVSLLQITDVVLTQIDMRITDIFRQTEDKVRTSEDRSASHLRYCIEEIRCVLDDCDLSVDDVRERIRELLPDPSVTSRSTAAQVRWELSDNARRTRPLLKQIFGLEFEEADDGLVIKHLGTLKEMYESTSISLLKNVDIKFAPKWGDVLVSKNRQQAMRGFEAAVLQELRHGLRNGSIWVRDSLSFRNREQLLIPPSQWLKSQKQFYRKLGLPLKSERYTAPLIANLSVGLEALAEAVRKKDVTIEDGDIHLKALEQEEKPSDLDQITHSIFKQIGTAQLSDLIVEMDSHIRFSWTLLGRPPVSSKELLSVYGALLAHGTDKTVSDVAMMIPGVSESSISEAMHLFEEDSLLTGVNTAVVDFIRSHGVADIWGEGVMASSDSMSLEASRHLWIARVDPKNRKYAIGIYTHVLDQWGIIYEQPIVINQRQAGHAIEGLVRQMVSPNVKLLAMDTHGYTNFSMSIGKLIGTDLCPRLKNLKERRLHIPQDLKVPKELESIVERDVSPEHLEAGWDGLIRIAASIMGGWSPAPLLLARFGSAACRGETIYKAGTSLGYLNRSIFLCDYMTNPTFRREILRIINYGEAIHPLQRAIHKGSMGTSRGRRHEELVAISGSLTLLTNLTMAWTTHKIQSIIDENKRQGKQPIDEEALRHIGPAHFKGINFNGQMQFPINCFAERLIPESQTKKRQLTN